MVRTTHAQVSNKSNRRRPRDPLWFRVALSVALNAMLAVTADIERDGPLSLAGTLPLAGWGAAATAIAFAAEALQRLVARDRRSNEIFWDQVTPALGAMLALAAFGSIPWYGVLIAVPVAMGLAMLDPEWRLYKPDSSDSARTPADPDHQSSAPPQ